MSFIHIRRRCLSALIDIKGKSQPRDFSLWPNIFTVPEQRILLAAALQKLDSVESRSFRRRREISTHATPEQSNIQGLFLPDECYQMEEVCFFHFVPRNSSSNGNIGSL